jgi:hypothetical protein
LCLTVDSNIRVSIRIGSLTSLEELTYLRIDDESTDAIEDLGLLTELRVLHIKLLADKWTEKLVESLCKLRKIQRLSITGRARLDTIWTGKIVDSTQDGWIEIGCLGPPSTTPCIAYTKVVLVLSAAGVDE